MTNLIGSPAIPVYVVPSSELLVNGGTRAVQGGPAVPLATSTGDAPFDLAQVLAAGNDANGEQITNLADPSSAQDAVTLAHLVAHLLGAKVYAARMTQTGTNAPVATEVFSNGLSGAIAWSYFAQGLYLGTLVGAFAANKVFGFVSTNGKSAASDVVNVDRSSNDALIVTTGTLGTSGSVTLANGRLAGCLFLVIVFP